MDKTRAKKMAGELKELNCCGWVIGEYINCGKSAVVLKAKKGSLTGAIKLFDPELIERYGVEVQEERVNREKSLIGKTHPNLVQILDGGFWKERDLFYVVMEYLPWRNLAEVLAGLPDGKEREVISQVASAAQHLEELGVYHRDIKPENIALSPDFQHVKLLDLGVIRLQGAPNITDGTNCKNFVGTLRYSPPEFLLRQEQDSAEGWRAVTYYQLGGVLHDIIMKKPLFAGCETPFAVLVNAIQDTEPEISSDSVSPALVELAKHCLLKKPSLRLELVSWEKFAHEPDKQDDVTDIKSRISRRAKAKRDQAIVMCKPPVTEQLDIYAENLVSSFRVERAGNQEYWPPIEIRAFHEGESERVIVAQFDPSVTLNLKNHFRIQFNLKWIGSENEAVIVKVSACLCSAAKSCKCECPASDALEVYKGLFNSESIWRKIRLACYQALELALQARNIIGSDVECLVIKLKEAEV